MKIYSLVPHSKNPPLGKRVLLKLKKKPNNKAEWVIGESYKPDHPKAHVITCFTVNGYCHWKSDFTAWCELPS